MHNSSVNKSNTIQKIKLSIIIPCYNAQQSIGKIVGSILGQEYKDFELILVNDGSTDDTLKVLNKLADKDGRIKVLNKPNGGPSSARNLGLDKAMGEYIQFYDADDDIKPESLSEIVQSMANNDMVVSGWQTNLHQNGKTIIGYKKLIPEHKVIDTNIKEFVLKSFGTDGVLYNLWNKMLKGDIIRANSLRFDENLNFGEDVLFALNYLKYIERLEILPIVSYEYTAGSATSVFKASSIIPENRHINDNGLLDYASNNLSNNEEILLRWVRYRWLVSYWSLILASNLSFKDKTSRIKAFQPNKLSLKSNPKLIGISNYTIQKLASLAKLNPYLSYALGWLVYRVKKIR